MDRACFYSSPLGPIVLTADQAGLTGLWLQGQGTIAPELLPPLGETPILTKTMAWLDVYFNGREPSFTVPLHQRGTPFQEEVWALLRTIPYGRVTTYGHIARLLAARRGLPRMSAQAVGGAVGRNTVSILVPCHRVVGADGSLIGYAGGTDKKERLLALEHADWGCFYVPEDVGVK